MTKINKTRISVTILPMVDIMLEKMSERIGTSKSALVETALKDFLEKQMEKDLKALSKLDFPDLPSEDTWLDIQTESST